MTVIQKPLIAIITCHKFQGRADAQRATWIKDIKGIDYKFFLSKGGREPTSDEVFLDVPDTYEGLSWKTQAVVKWAVENGYDAVFKCDDDTYLFPDRLKRIYPQSPYEGRINTSNSQLAPRGWCSGFAYWLAGPALKIIMDAGEPTNKAEDLWVGITLNKHNIIPVSQAGFKVLSVISPTMWHSFKDQVIAACEFRDSMMLEFDKVMKNPCAYNPTIHNTMNPNTGKRVARFGEVLRRRR